MARQDTCFEMGEEAVREALQRMLSPPINGAEEKGRQYSVHLAAWNVRGYAANKKEVARLLDSGQAHVLFLTETKLSDVTQLAGFKGQVIIMAAPIIKRRLTMGVDFMSRNP